MLNKFNTDANAVILPGNKVEISKHLITAESARTNDKQTATLYKEV